ncbi:hypothetical protein [Gelidibacter gilvus]|uniref:hypothetical protein n=1 Tax=Gelidibacter gilvus TaxID=59602 RepID=UPI00100C2891|nr:hypothetical protein [Gelidibacter gilvus]
MAHSKSIKTTDVIFEIENTVVEKHLSRGIVRSLMLITDSSQLMELCGYKIPTLAFVKWSRGD